MGMEASALIPKLVETLEKLGVEVRFEVFSEEDFCRIGGVCRIDGRAVLFVNRRIAAPEKARLLIKTLREHDLEGIYLSPVVRRAISDDVL